MMTLQVFPIVAAEGATDAEGNVLRDLPFLGPRNTLLPVFRLRPPLDGDGFQIAFVWLQLSGMWCMRKLLTRDGTEVTLGIMLTSSGVDLLAPVSAERRPAGQLWYGFDGGLSGHPQRDSWRGTATLYYRPSALVTALAGSSRALL